METIIVSACLLGDKCRYDGKDNYNENVKFLREHFDIVPVCPEQFGGLSTPREPSELRGSIVVTKSGKDFTKYFEKGRDNVLNIVRYMHIKKAVLMDRSPSCGVKQIHNGRFDERLIDGQGLTTRALIEMGVEVFTIDEVEKLIDKTPKEIFEMKEAEIKAKEEAKAEKARLNAEYSKADNKVTDRFKEENIKPYSEYKKEFGIVDDEETTQSYRKPYQRRDRNYSDRPRSSSNYGQRRDYGSFRKDRNYSSRQDGEHQSYGEKRNYSDRKPSYSNDRSSYGDRKPSYNNDRSSHGDRKPSYSNDRSSYGNRKPYSKDRNYKSDNYKKGYKKP